MCSADSVRAEKTKVAKTSVSVGQKYSCLTVIVFCGLWTSYALCVEAYKAEPFRWTVVPSRDLHVSVVGCVSPPPSSGSGGRENEKLRSLRALKQTLKQLALSVRILRVRGKVTFGQ